LPVLLLSRHRDRPREHYAAEGCCSTPSDSSVGQAFEAKRQQTEIISALYDAATSDSERGVSLGAKVPRSTWTPGVHHHRAIGRFLEREGASRRCDPRHRVVWTSRERGAAAYVRFHGVDGLVPERKSLAYCILRPTVGDAKATARSVRRG